MPEAGSVVTCRVLGVNPNQARVSILCVGQNKLHTPVLGTVRKLNVRDHQVDTVSYMRFTFEILNCQKMLKLNQNQQDAKVVCNSS